MEQFSKRIGIDIGGSHISYSVITANHLSGKGPEVKTRPLDSYGEMDTILASISACINEVIGQDSSIAGIGLAFPGPFDYQKGISAITGVGGKFQTTFGLHLKQALQDRIALKDVRVGFSNDAECFVLGYLLRYKPADDKILFLTLGTGLGSSFTQGGRILTSGSSIPPNGYLYNQPFLDAMGEDYISGRWFLKEYKARTGQDISSVQDLAETGSPDSLSVFEQFGHNLGAFLLPWIKKFGCTALVIGGNIAKAHSLFNDALTSELGDSVSLSYCTDTEACILTGAALIPALDTEYEGDENSKVRRKTNQPLLPLSVDEAPGIGYSLYPSFSSGKNIYVGFDSLAKAILGERTVIIDGYGGVLWENFRSALHRELQKYGASVSWYSVESCMKEPERIEKMIASSLNGDDPVFGKKYTGVIANFFDKDKLELLIPGNVAGINIVYGTGAALSGWKGKLVYIDVPKNEIQYRMRAGSVLNLGMDASKASAAIYKRFYFIDWPVLNKHKEELLPELDIIVDEQRADTITWMHGHDFRETLSALLDAPVRARPWFEPGVWGGNWMKDHIPSLNKKEVNYAWSFELITPENGIVLEGDRLLLEVSFDFLLYHNHRQLLGKAAARFGKEFPIRFDFLDTFDGGNLSVQCHPRTAYIREQFGESFTQDETYYILDCKDSAKVYLGFQEDIDPERFRHALINAQQKGEEVDIEKFVQVHPAGKHDLFLIPNGTIHASGKNNMVLEISNTPYIFTFKMYDWLRLDLDGRPRPINIGHAFNNLYFDRKGDYVGKYLISHPKVEKEWQGGRKVKLPTHQEHFYTVDRYEFSGEIQIETEGQCHCCMLVEGTAIVVKTGDRENRFRYAETFIIPAGVGSYSVRSAEKAFLVIAYVKDECC